MKYQNGISGGDWLEFWGTSMCPTVLLHSSFMQFLATVGMQLWEPLYFLSQGLGVLRKEASERQILEMSLQKQETEPEVQGDRKNEGCFHSCGEIVLKLGNWFVAAKIGSNIPKSGMQVPLSKYQDLGCWSGTWQNCSDILSMHQLFWVLITGRLLQPHFNTPRCSQCPLQTLPLRFDL